MREEQRGAWCVLSFGQEWTEARDAAIAKGDLDPGDDVVLLNNPMPTGDHWKAIGWVIDYIRSGERFISSVPMARRAFIKRAAERYQRGQCFCMVLSSMAARNYRDTHELRMQRGRVYVIVGRKPVVVEAVPEQSSDDAA